MVNLSDQSATENGQSIEFEQTCQMPAEAAVIADDEFAELLTLARAGSFSKQEIDFALATSLIRGKYISERRLRTVLKGWTSFGNLSLGQFLQRKNVLPKDDLSAVEQDVIRHLKALESHRSWGPCSVSIAKRTSWLLDHLDPGGRVAKVLGLSQIPKIAEGGDSRSFETQFRLIRKLGQGGLGTVWLAVDAGLNRYVAIKEITGGAFPSPTAAARFQREAEITGRLDHPGIVPIHLLGHNEADGRPFYVMRFLGNRTLDDAIREYHERRELAQDDPLAFHQLLTAFVSVCHAIAYAHSRQVIHRDLKPQNIALDDFGQVIVLDWGLARIMGLDEPAAHLRAPSAPHECDSLDITLAGQVMGTPIYMAPEQAAGRLDEIDERTDVYGLGAILFAILTGYAPHELSSESLGAGGQMASLLDVIVDRPPTRPRRINAQVPAALEAICLKALAKERHLRYSSATALAEELQRWIANEPITAMKESGYRRLRRWIGKHPRLSQLTAALTLLLMAGALTAGTVSYQRVAAANHLQVQTAIDETRELKAQLATQVETLAGNVRFMSTLPPIQGILDARLNRKTDLESVWTDRLNRIYGGLLDVNPSYVAVTYWIQRETAGGRSVRVESGDVKRGLLRTDLTAFFSRHLPAITNLSRGEIYVGVPGRWMEDEDKADHPQVAAILQNDEPIGRCMVAGAGVYDGQTEAKVGGVVIECDLERILRDQLSTASTRVREVFLTDSEGRPVMRFTREYGLRPFDSVRAPAPSSPALNQFFSEGDADDVLLAAPTVCAAKVPLDRHRSERWLGLIVHFEK
jgi:serine/threonine protein kinase